MMTEHDDTAGPGGHADAELADAVHSIEATGEDWRSRERAVDSDDRAGAPSDDSASRQEGEDHG